MGLTLFVKCCKIRYINAMRIWEGVSVTAPTWAADLSRLYSAIGQNARAAREQVGFSQDQLASLVGISRTSMAQFEAGHQHLPLETIYQIAQALGADIYAFLPSLRDLAPMSPDILGKVARDASLEPVEREALLTFFRRYIPAPK